MGDVSKRRYRPPIYGADWTVSARDTVAIAASAALSRHVPGWAGATDKQLDAVAAAILSALDAPTVECRHPSMQRVLSEVGLMWHCADCGHQHFKDAP